MQARYSKREIGRAGRALASSASPAADRRAAEEAVNYWRRIHEQPLTALLKDAEAITEKAPGAVIAGRIKKLDTIIDKITRPNAPADLQTMYDIAGCRIVVPSIEAQESLRRQLSSHPALDTAKTARRDYIAHPKPSGYRSTHMIFRYPDLPCGHTLFAELQIRTLLQHSWATAVEIYDAATESRLKFNELDNPAGRFFLEASRLIEGLELHGGTEAAGMFDDPQSAQHVIDELAAACEASSILGEVPRISLDKFCLITFDLGQQALLLEQLDESAAFATYFLREAQRVEDTDLVLVKGASIEKLKQLYPNYFGDVSAFVSLARRFLPPA